jgi:hypothetical protein
VVDLKCCFDFLDVSVLRDQENDFAGGCPRIDQKNCKNPLMSFCAYKVSRLADLSAEIWLCEFLLVSRKVP